MKIYIIRTNTKVMALTTSFTPVSLGLTHARTYLFGAAFIAGNLILPQLCHFIPDGGKMLLPIYFFTLIASYKFGLRVGLLTAVCSPLLNCFLFGMPPVAVLPVLLVKSSLLAVAAAYVASSTHKLSLLHVAVAVLAYQVVGGLAEWMLAGSLVAALQDLTLGLPGIGLQIAGGWLALKLLAKYEF